MGTTNANTHTHTERGAEFKNAPTYETAYKNNATGDWKAGSPIRMTLESPEHPALLTALAAADDILSGAKLSDRQDLSMHLPGRTSIDFVL